MHLLTQFRMASLCIVQFILLASCSTATPISEDVTSTAKAVLPAQEKLIPVGLKGTPYLPNSQWRVHDGDRPHPQIVAPGASYGKPPSDAIVLFDGSDLSEWSTRSPDGETWLLKDGAIVIPKSDKRRKPTLVSNREFGDIQLHIEWQSPAVGVSNSQGRGNSGIFFMEKYEVQILDSYENVTYADGQASALYGWKPPLVNASREPGTWQTYDIIFEAPEFGDAGELISPAYVTVFHNNVLTQHRQKYLGISTFRKVSTYVAHEPKGRIALQDHSNPVSFRNIWVRELDLNSNQ